MSQTPQQSDSSSALLDVLMQMERNQRTMMDQQAAILEQQRLQTTLLLRQELRQYNSQMDWRNIILLPKLNGEQIQNHEYFQRQIANDRRFEENELRQVFSEYGLRISSQSTSQLQEQLRRFLISPFQTL